MKHIARLLLFVVIPTIGFSQENSQPRFLLEGTGLLTKFDGIEYRQGGGLNFDYFLGKKVSTHYVAYFGPNYFELSPGVVTVPFVLLMLGDEIHFDNLQEFGAFLFLFAISFENIALHFNLSDKMVLSPSISLFRMRYFYEDISAERRNYLCMSGSAGIKLNQKIGKRLTVGAFAEGNMLYTGGNPIGFTTGFTIGFYFPKKDQ